MPTPQAKPKPLVEPNIAVLDTWLTIGDVNAKVKVIVKSSELRVLIHKALANKSRRAAAGPIRVIIESDAPRLFTRAAS